MIDLIDVCRLEEARQAKAISEIAVHWRPCAGGVLSRGEPRAYINMGCCLGLSGPVTTDEVEEMIQWFIPHGIQPQLEVTPFADPSLVHALAARGFHVRSFERVLFRELTEDPLPTVPAPAGLVLHRVNPRDEADCREHVGVVLAGFTPPGQTPAPDMFELAMKTVRHPRAVSVSAMLDGRCVGGGGLEVAGDIAAIFGASVAPEYRRRGIQQALLAWRLREARAAGATLATIGSRPAMPTERNVRRMGFQVAYDKVAMIRPGPGLIPNND